MMVNETGKLIVMMMTKSAHTMQETRNKITFFYIIQTDEIREWSGDLLLTGTLRYAH